MAFLAPFIPALIGGAGLIMNQDAQRRKNNAQNRALSFQEDQYNTITSPALKRLKSLAEGYDPVAESRYANDYATERAQDTIGKAIRSHDTNYRVGGGTPGNSTLEPAMRARAMQPATQMLAGRLADNMSNATAKQMAVWQQVLGNAPAGNMSQAYFNHAQSMPQADFSGSAQMIGDVIGGLIKPQAKPGGAGGKGDKRGGSDTASDGGDLGVPDTHMNPDEVKKLIRALMSGAMG